MVTKNQTLKILKIYLFFEILFGVGLIVALILTERNIFQTTFSVSGMVGVFCVISLLSAYCTLGVWARKNW